jgi:hypothetical protein
MIKYLRTNYQGEYLRYLQSGNYLAALNDSTLLQCIKANEILQALVRKHPIDSNLTIQYFKKNLDEERVWLGCKELGYRYLTKLESHDPALAQEETNTVAFGSKVRLLDIQAAALNLIRSGFKVQYISRSKPGKESVIQLIRTDPARGKPATNPGFRPEEIIRATSIRQINRE